MPANSGLPDNSQRIPVLCDCGKKLVANSSQIGKRLKCPACGQIVVVQPVPAGVIPTPATAASEPHPAPKPRTKTSNWRLMTALWLLVVSVAIGAGAYLRFDGKWRQQAHIDAANTEVREAVKTADGWLKQGSAKEGEDVEQRLTKAIASKDVSEKANADAVLETVRTRRAELAADSLFDSAKTKLDAKAIPEAVALLNRYVADPHATKKAEAKQLLADCDLATSEKAALQTLTGMSDEQFVQFESTGKLDDRKIRHPILAELRSAALRRNLETAKERREEKKIAEAHRQKEADKIAEGDRQKEAVKLAEADRQNSEHLAADLLAAEDAKAAKKQQTEQIRANLVGNWRWGPTDSPSSIKFVQDGTFVETGDGGVALRGRWSVDEDATIRLAGEPGRIFPVVKMNLNEDKISIEHTTRGKHTEAAAARFSDIKMNPVAAADARAAKNQPRPRFSSAITFQTKDQFFKTRIADGKTKVRIAEQEKTRSEQQAKPITESDIAGVWNHSADALAQRITLLPTGKIDDPAGRNTWTLRKGTKGGTILVLRWADPRAPGGFWIDTCGVYADGNAYQGHSKQGMFISGMKVKGKLSTSYNSVAAKNAQEEHRLAVMRVDAMAPVRRAQEGAEWVRRKQAEQSEAARSGEDAGHPVKSTMPEMFKESASEAERRRQQESSDQKARVDRQLRESGVIK